MENITYKPYKAPNNANNKWHKFQKEYAKECKANGVVYSMKNASDLYNKKYNITRKPVSRSSCYSLERGDCSNKIECAWRTPKTLTKSGVPRISYCTKLNEMFTKNANYKEVLDVIDSLKKSVDESWNSGYISEELLHEYINSVEISSKKLIRGIRNEQERTELTDKLNDKMNEIRNHYSNAK